MQAAKDSFYVAFRDGIAASNPARTMAVRGVIRPAVLVIDNELATAIPLADAFRLRWTECALDTAGTVALAKQRCEIRYETAGTAAAGGMDRGRMLTAMDAELLQALSGAVQTTAKMDFSQGAPQPLGTQIFWSEPVLSAAAANGERLSRVAVVDVWSLESTAAEGSVGA